MTIYYRIISGTKFIPCLNFGTTVELRQDQVGKKLAKMNQGIILPDKRYIFRWPRRNALVFELDSVTRRTFFSPQEVMPSS